MYQIKQINAGKVAHVYIYVLHPHPPPTAPPRPPPSKNNSGLLMLGMMLTFFICARISK